MGTLDICIKNPETMSGLSELYSILQDSSIQFNDVAKLKYVITEPGIVGHLQTVRKPFITRNDYLNLLPDSVNKGCIQILHQYPHMVVSSAYGCCHDFHDVKTASEIYNINKGIFNIKTTSSDPLVINFKNILNDQFSPGLKSSNTPKLVKIWETAQKYIDDQLIAIEAVFPTIDFTMIRDNTADKHDKDVTMIKNFLNNKGINPERIVWVVDTFPGWLGGISQNKLNISDSIATIDGASVTLVGNISHTLANLQQIVVGPYTFAKNKIKPDFPYPILIIKDTSVIGGCGDSASVTTIINRMTSLGMNTDTMITRSNEQGVYLFFTNNPPVKTLDEQKQILEYIKAAGDQAPIDIINSVISDREVFKKNYIPMLSTGDNLAYLLALSQGIPALYVTSTIIKISIPTSMTGSDRFTPKLLDLRSKIDEYEKYKYFFIRIPTILGYIDRLEKFSKIGKFFSYIFYNAVINYLNSINDNLIKLNYSCNIINEPGPANDIKLLKFYKYIEENFNNISFNPIVLLDILLRPVTDDYSPYEFISKTITEGEFVKKYIETSTRPPIPPKVRFCDERKYKLKNPVSQNSCVNHVEFAKRENPANYIKAECYGDDNCLKAYGSRTNMLKQINPPTLPPNIITSGAPIPYKNLEKGNFDKGWLKAGEIRLFTEPAKSNAVTGAKYPGKITDDVLLDNVFQDNIDFFFNIPYDVYDTDDFQLICNRGKYIIKSLVLLIKYSDNNSIIAEDDLVNIIIDILTEQSNCPTIFPDDTATQLINPPVYRPLRSAAPITTPIPPSEGIPKLMVFYSNLLTRCDINKLILDVIATPTLLLLDIPIYLIGSPNTIISPSYYIKLASAPNEVKTRLADITTNIDLIDTKKTNLLSLFRVVASGGKRIRKTMKRKPRKLVKTSKHKRSVKNKRNN